MFISEENPYKLEQEEDHVLLIQTVLDKAMKKDCLVNELFLQLIKQTTDHPEPNSRVNLRHWSLVALACSVILPVDKLVRKYLLAHFPKHYVNRKVPKKPGNSLIAPSNLDIYRAGNTENKYVG